MTNTTDYLTTLDPVATFKIPITWYLYVIQGTFIVIMNLLIFMAIMRFSSLRKKKEYLVIASMAFADILGGLSFWLLGVWRIIIVDDIARGIRVSGWWCVTHFYPVPLLMFSTGAVAYMKLCVSVDRLLAVFVPLKYYKFGPSYARKLCGVVYLLAFFTMCAFVHSSYFYRTDVLIQCSTAASIGDNDFMQRFYYYHGLVAGAASVVVYLFIPVIYLRNMNKLGSSASDSVTKQRLKNQRRLIITMGWLSFTTLCTYVVGNLAGVVLVENTYPKGSISKDTAVTWKVVVAVIKNVDPMLNIMFYFVRQKDIRAAIMALLTCKSKMPQQTVVPTVMKSAIRE